MFDKANAQFYDRTANDKENPQHLKGVKEGIDRMQSERIAEMEARVKNILEGRGGA